MNRTSFLAAAALLLAGPAAATELALLQLTDLPSGQIIEVVVEPQRDGGSPFSITRPEAPTLQLQAALSQDAQGIEISQAGVALAVLPLTGAAVEIAAVSLRLSAEPITRDALARKLAEARPTRLD
jgi:hypothetical protein